MLWLKIGVLGATLLVAAGITVWFLRGANKDTEGQGKRSHKLAVCGFAWIAALVAIGIIFGAAIGAMITAGIGGVTAISTGKIIGSAYVDGKGKNL